MVNDQLLWCPTKPVRVKLAVVHAIAKADRDDRREHGRSPRQLLVHVDEQGRPVLVEPQRL